MRESMTAAATQPDAERAAAQGPLLRIDGLGVRFAGSDRPAVEDVRLSVHEGQTVAVVGESGCGKTVTALSVLRLLDEQTCQRTGAIEWDSRNLLDADEKHMRRVRGGEIAMIFQEPMTSLNPVYTIGDQIAEAARLHRDAGKGRAAELAMQAMDAVGIDQPKRRVHQYPHEFSGGMRQRAMIAMALVCDPKLLIADEPTTALDVTTQAKILELLRELRNSRGMAVLLITHDFGVVAQNADIVCVMYGGRVVEYGAVRELFDCPLHPYTQGLLAAMPTLRDRKQRLATVHATVRRSPAFAEGVQGRKELIPWWPGDDASTVDSLLYEVQPGRWVQCVRNSSLGGEAARTPVLGHRRV